ncbi:MAG: transketolase [Candidatus Sumerlaeia bacterium]|nr:transketolase [Candidatus Sumerlaeia bacterium]
MTAAVAVPKIDKSLLARLARTIRGLAIDGVERANSGHPGMPLGCADFAALLWFHHLRFDPAAPDWWDRDRFVLSAGHGSMLLYALLHLSGFEEATLDELRNFRQWGSKTPGHPENFVLKGVETTTGPLGQGIANAVGMALAAEMMEARFPGLFGTHVYTIAGDGDLMEGVSAEACSFAGHHRLGGLIVFYDDNRITIEGDTDLTFSGEDVAKRYEAYGWHVQRCDGHDFDAMNAALAAAQAETARPSIIIGRTHIGFGSPNKVDTADVHGSPLGPEEAKLTKAALGLPADVEFYVPAEDYEAWKTRAAEGAAARTAWERKLQAMPAATREALAAYFQKPVPELAKLRPAFEPGKGVATRKSAGDALNAYAPAVPWLVGGSADLAPSTNTILKNAGHIGAEAFAGRNLHFGVREHGMGAIMNGMALFGAFKPYGATFLQFADYMRPSVRLAALMGLPVVFVFTHDSIFLGEDGPTHQPVEHLAALRAIPRLLVIRPADANEAAVAWEVAIEATDGPVALALSRQNLTTVDRAGKGLGSADGLRKGGYVLRKESKDAPRLILIATGSEVELALKSADALEAEGVPTRVVSMPCVELFAAQPREWRDSVLPPTVRRRLVIEAGVRQGWEGLATDEGGFVTQDTFGHSAPAKVLAEHCGFTVANVVARARELWRD